MKIADRKSPITMRNLLIAAALVLLTGAATVPVPAAQKDDAAGAWLKSSYLASIHDDCRVFLEGIELFTQRDYPVFLQNMQNGSAVARADAAAYISELKHFEKLLDSLYDEYITFKKASLTTPAGDAPKGKTGLTEIEQRLFQMLAYAYLRTGDFAMARMLIMNHDILSSDFTIRIRNIEGQLVDFPLTRQLKERFKETNNLLTTLTIRFKNFFATDIPEDINAYIRVSGYDRKEPVNILFMEYYGRLFPGLNAGSDKDNLIHVGQIIKFFNIQKYRNNLLSGADAREDQGYDTTYTFPMVKGNYELVVRDPTIAATAPSDNEIVLERLCLFKGLARTDFRTLKEEQRQQQEQQMIVAEDLTLLQPGKSYTSYRPGQMVPYGTYALFEKNRHLGTLELIPCYRGGKCREPENRDPGVTPVRIFDHTFVLYRDVLDLVQQSQATRSALEFEASQKAKEVHLFPGCATEVR